MEQPSISTTRMKDFIEQLLVNALNRKRASTPRPSAGIVLGHAPTGSVVSVPQAKRTEHIVIVGRTGAGKSSLMRSMIEQDIEAGRGCVVIDLHGEMVAFALRALRRRELNRRIDVSPHVVVIDPTDDLSSVGLNVLAADDRRTAYVHIAEITAILKQRWQLDTFGARTDELTRNSLIALSEAGLTLVDLPPFLTNRDFRATCLRSTTNGEVRSFFEQRFDRASEAMTRSLTEPVINKTTVLTADPQLRHMLGQRQSTISLSRLLDENAFVLLSLNKSALGESAPTLASLFFTKLKNAIFSRRRRQLSTIFADEVQNLVAHNNDLETVFSEARKFGCSLVTTNQYLDQIPPSLRAAVLSIGTHVFFALAPPDAEKVTSFLGGGKPLRHLLANLPPRHFVVKSGHHEWQEGVVPTVTTPRADAQDLYERCRARWTRRRAEIEAEIQARQHVTSRAEALDDWE